MGFRAIRYCLKHKDLFKTQLRAIVRASAFGDVRIMFPLITAVEELREGKALVEEVKAELREQGVEFNENIPVGIMTETSAAVMIADILAKESDFSALVQMTLRVIQWLATEEMTMLHICILRYSQVY